LARKKVVDEKELVQILSSIARGEAGEEIVKVSERLKAAELLGKRYSLFGSGDSGDSEVRVVVDYGGQCNGQV
jgi:flavodoxin